MKVKFSDRLRTPLRFQAGLFFDRKLMRRTVPSTASAPTPEGEGRKLPIRLWAAAGIGFILFAHWEMSTAALESRFFSTLATKMKYSVAPGRSSLITFPRNGPFDRRYGYSRVPDFTKRLEDRGFKYRSQARFTRTLAFMSNLGVPPP